ncbi:MAG: hypothetical protein EBZ48_11535 [Proteobacteria bacterium]|nr:hypothetical protein [Pseudomonadota bacterium]
MDDTTGKKLRESVEIERTDSAQIEAHSSDSGASISSQVERVKIRQKSYLLDLRIHTPASLGYLSIGGIDTAPALVRLAKVKGLDIIALTDFYSAEFIDRVRDAAKDSPLTILPGVVLRCKVGICDDVSIAVLFPEHYSGVHVAQFLERIKVPAGARGDRRFLLKTPFREILAEIERSGGIALPSRLDKTPHRQSAIPVLVEEYGFRAFDLAYPDSARYFKKHWPKTKFNLFCFSNAHALAQVGSRMAKLKMSEGGFAGVRSVLTRQHEG